MIVNVPAAYDAESWAANFTKRPCKPVSLSIIPMKPIEAVHVWNSLILRTNRFWYRICSAFELFWSDTTITATNSKSKNPNTKNSLPNPENPTPKPQTQKSVAFHTLAFCPWHFDQLGSALVFACCVLSHCRPPVRYRNLQRYITRGRSLLVHMCCWKNSCCLRIQGVVCGICQVSFCDRATGDWVNWDWSVEIVC